MSGGAFRITMNPADKILLKRGLEKNGKGQLFFSAEFGRLCTRYVPRRSGTLRASMWVEPSNVSWNTPYARRQYYEHKRMSRWAEKCWRDRKADIVRATARYCGLSVK